ncbi:hypothetical protein L915_09241, partial [Phytophthora nicotianae]
MEMAELCERTGRDWYGYCRETCSKDLLKVLGQTKWHRGVYHAEMHDAAVCLQASQRSVQVE